MKVAVIGLGLIGGSLCKALKAASSKSYHIIAISRKKDALSAAIKMKAADEASLNLGAAADADIIVIATPVDNIVPIYKKLIPIVKNGAIITDAGSIKEPIEKQIESLYRKRGFASRGIALPAYVGAHPMSGKETNGFENSESGLFKNANVVITGSIKKSAKNEKIAAKMWLDTGAKIIKMPAKKHDELVALTSHLPHLMAFALNKIYRDKRTTDRQIEKIVAGSFYSAIRVASSSADMWAPIFSANKKQIKKNLSFFIKELKNFENHLSVQTKIKKQILDAQK
ncbi:MAG: prephenate dehydrogenase/arogenate dehydrogenase family protein [Endomicrobium sp.]|nr:prephenate dehydrogenase/arogenate dehydrogenase family protein [Endomicrobium sp.]